MLTNMYLREYKGKRLVGDTLGHPR